MGPGIGDTLQTHDLPVDLLQFIRGTAGDLQEKIEISGLVIAGNNGVHFLDRLREGVEVTGMFQAHLHQGDHVVACALFVYDDGIFLDHPVFLQLSQPLDHRRHGKMDLLADVGCRLSGISLQDLQNFIIDAVHSGLSSLSLPPDGRSSEPSVRFFQRFSVTLLSIPNFLQKSMDFPNFFRELF